MDRLSKSVYGEGYEMNQHPDAFTETYDYDANGNITGLIRKKDGTIIDKLKYAYYSGTNKINNITDLSKKADGYPVTEESYTYDKCGNPTYDPSKMAYITYSKYNKPLEVSASATDMVRYSYTSTGTKLRREVTSMSSTSDGVTDYSYNFLYEDNELVCIFAPFGRVIPMNTSNGNKWRYHYTIADHLGNARVEFVAHGGAQPEVVQTSSYYPFGMTLRRNDYGSHNVNKYLYGSKELQDQTLAGITLNWYDFEARMYDPTIGRFLQTDPKAEKYFDVSPYTYCLNNPIMFIDPDGMETEALGQQLLKIEPFGEEEEAAYKAYRDKVFSDKRYENIQKELIRLENADEVFRIRMGNNTTKQAGGGNFIYNIETGEFDVNIADNGDFSTMAKLSHELKHADQYMDGKLGFDLRDPKMVVQFAYDFLDEVEAFERQGLFGKTLNFDGIKNCYQALWIKGCFDVNQTIWKCAYDNIQLPFNLIIKGNTDSYKKYSKPIYLYHGWQNDIK